jgi:hypothetical protein
VLYNVMVDGKCSNKVLQKMDAPVAGDIVMLDKRIKQELECLLEAYTHDDDPRRQRRSSPLTPLFKIDGQQFKFKHTFYYIHVNLERLS